jgi:hypothetical protein
VPIKTLYEWNHAARGRPRYAWGAA